MGTPFRRAISAMLLLLACFTGGPGLAQVTMPTVIKYGSVQNADGTVLLDASGAVQGTNANPVVMTPATTAVTTVVGNVADGATATGNAVRVGTIARSGTFTSYSAGQQVSLGTDTTGNLLVIPTASAVTPFDTGTTAGYAFSRTGTSVSIPIATLNGYWDTNSSKVFPARGDANGGVVQPALSGSFIRYPSPAGGVAPSTAQTAAFAAAGASVRNYVMSMQCQHDTLSAAVEMQVQDGSTAMWRGKMQTAATDLTGATINFDPPLRGTANTAVNYTFSGTATGAVLCSFQGYTGL